MRIVLWLQPAYEQDVSARLKTEPLQRLGAFVTRVLDPVRNHADALAVTTLEDVRHGVRVGDRLVRPARRRALGEAKVGLGEAGPLAAIGVEAVDVDHRRNRGSAGDQTERRVAGDEEQRHVRLGHPGSVDGREQRVYEGVQVLVLNRAQVDKVRALIRRELAVDDVRAAIDHDGMPAGRQTRRELLDGRLKATVRGGYPPGAEDRDLHRLLARE